MAGFAAFGFALAFAAALTPFENTDGFGFVFAAVVSLDLAAGLVVADLGEDLDLAPGVSKSVGSGSFLCSDALRFGVICLAFWSLAPALLDDSLGVSTADDKLSWEPSLEVVPNLLLQAARSTESSSCLLLLRPPPQTKVS